MIGMNKINYEDIILQKGIKTKLIIHADKKHLNGCNSEINFKKPIITNEILIENFCNHYKK